MITPSHSGSYLISGAPFRLSQHLLQSVSKPCRMASTPSIQEPLRSQRGKGFVVRHRPRLDGGGASCSMGDNAPLCPYL